jgi:hypothetical protein
VAAMADSAAAPGHMLSAPQCDFDGLAAPRAAEPVTISNNNVKSDAAPGNVGTRL